MAFASKAQQRAALAQGQDKGEVLSKGVTLMKTGKGGTKPVTGKVTSSGTPAKMTGKPINAKKGPRSLTGKIA